MKTLPTQSAPTYKAVCRSQSKTTSFSMLRVNQSGFLTSLILVVTFEKVSILLLVITSFHLALGQLVVLSECVCPGRELRLECTVVGLGSTVWSGTAFDCPGEGNEILLRHTQFESGGLIGECNNGMIIAQSHNITFDGPNSKFTSQLTISLPLPNATSNTLEGRTVECIYDDGTTTTVIDTHTIAYTRCDPNTWQSPDDIYLAKVSILTFEWYPVQSVCPDTWSDVGFARLTFCWSPIPLSANPTIINYRTMAEGCGICPCVTSSSCVTCVSNSPVNTTCTFSVQSVVCENIYGNFSDPVTFKLGVPDAPNFERILPYYSNTSHKLLKLDLYFSTTSKVTSPFNTSCGLNESIASYTFNVYSISDLSSSICWSLIIPASSCQENTTCNLELIIDGLLTPCHNNYSHSVMLTAFASNVFGDGPPSVPVVIETTNTLLYVKFDAHATRFSCQFTIGNFGNGPKSCKITYGLQDPITHHCLSSITLENSTNTNILDTVIVFLPKLDHTDSEFCFTAIGKAATFTVAVEGIFRTGAGNQLNRNEFEVTISFSFVALLTVLLTILIITIILLARGRARALKELSLLRESERRQNVTYEEINLTPSAINTSENVAYGQL